MAIGGSPTSRRITAWHHTCCNTVRWSGQRVCDLCGTQAVYYNDGVPIGIVMARLHFEDKPDGTAARPQPPAAAPPARATAAVTAAPEATTAPTTSTSGSPVSPGNQAQATGPPVSVPGPRPPGARPHRPHEEDTSPGLPPPRPAHVRRWRALHTIWLAGALALVLALDAAASADGGDPLLPMLIAVAAVLLVVVVPMAMAGRPGEAAQ